MEIRIRRLAPADAQAYRALRLRGLQAHPEAFTTSHEEAQREPPEQSARRLDASQSGEKFWGAFDGPTLVGIAGLAFERRAKNRHKGTLVGMYVAPEAQGGGAGRRLVEAVLDEALQSGLELVVLTVTRGNAAARRLYARCGFASFGIEPRAIKVDGVAYDKEHMALLLTPATAAGAAANHSASTPATREQPIHTP